MAKKVIAILSLIILSLVVYPSSITSQESFEDYIHPKCVELHQSFAKRLFTSWPDEAWVASCHTSPTSSPSTLFAIWGVTSSTPPLPLDASCYKIPRSALVDDDGEYTTSRHWFKIEAHKQTCPSYTLGFTGSVEFPSGVGIFQNGLLILVEATTSNAGCGGITATQHSAEDAITQGLFFRDGCLVGAEGYGSWAGEWTGYPSAPQPSVVTTTTTTTSLDEEDRE